ncbi:PASTA domain-containing protein [bacterium]|nr:PASTA domain-containing protein [bacterium]
MMSKRNTDRRRRATRLLGGFLVTLFLLALGVIVVLAVVFVRSCGSGAAQEVTVPSVLSMTVEDAERALNELNLGLRVVDSTFSDEQPAGVVLRQQPPSGSRVREGRVVGVVRSLGKQSLKVPDLVGSTLADAQKKLSLSKLSVGTVQKVYLKKRRQGVVVKQNPEPGKMFNSPVRVDLTVACTDADYAIPVPQVVGRPLYVAERLLRNSNLAVRNVAYIASPQGEPGEVISQSLEAGTSARFGAGVDLTVSVPRELAEGAVHRFRFKFRLPSGLPGGELKLVAHDELGQAVVYRDEVEAGETVEQILVVQGRASIMVYFNGTLIREDTI